MGADLSKVLWVIQGNRLGWIGRHDTYKLTSFLDHQGTPYREIDIRPFDESKIEVEWDGPVLFYGSTRLVERVFKQNEWKPGAYYDPALFSMSIVHSHYGKRMLNDECSMGSLESLLSKNYDPDKELFVRPVMDLKEFVGATRRFKELPELLEKGSVSTATKESLVLWAETKDIQREWRTIVVDGKVVAASQYKKDGQLLRSDEDHFTPPDVKDFAEDCAVIYKPAPVFVLDVAELPGGQLRVIETNCFNCAGWYWADFRSIAFDVTRYTAERYK